MIVAQINSNGWIRLGSPPPELLSLSEFHNCVRTRLALRTQQIGFSDQNQIVQSAVFTPSTRTHNLTATLAVPAIEAWLEQKLGDTDHYRLIEIVNLAEIERARNAGRRAAAFHGDESGIRYVTLAFDVDGTQEFRLWYDPQSETTVANAANSLLPGDLNILVELEACADAIDLITSRLTRATENEEERHLMQMKVAGWQQMKAGFMLQIPQWEELYKRWLNRSRGSQVSGNLPRKLKRGLWT